MPLKGRIVGSIPAHHRSHLRIHFCILFSSSNDIGPSMYMENIDDLFAMQMSVNNLSPINTTSELDIPSKCVDKSLMQNGFGNVCGMQSMNWSPSIKGSFP